MSASILENCVNTCSTLLGDSNLGTWSAPTYPKFANGPHPNGSPFPWGSRDVSNCNPYDDTQIPNTGVTRFYDWTVTNTTMAPDGVELAMLVVNNAFPGPTVEANWGDWIEVSVTNGMEKEVTSVHWHGFLQTGTPWVRAEHHERPSFGYLFAWNLPCSVIIRCRMRKPQDMSLPYHLHYMSSHADFMYY